MRETAFSQTNSPFKHSISRYFAIVLLSILLVSVTANAQEYRSGWDVVNSGVTSDLFSVEGEGEEIWVFGENGIVLGSQNSGAIWTQMESMGPSNLTMSDSGFGAFLAAGKDGTVIIKIDSGSQWEDISFDAGEEDIRGVSLNGNSSVVIVGSNGSIWKYDSGSWSDYSISGVDLLDVSFLDSERGIAVGEEGAILFSDDGGITWDYRDAPSEASSSRIIDVEFYSDIRAYAITDMGEVMKSSREISTPVGFLWNMQYFESEGGSSNLGVNLTSIEVATTNKFLLSGTEGYLSMSKDGGNIVNRQMIPIDNLTAFNDIAMLDGFRGIAVGSNGSILITERAGEDEQVGFEVRDFSEFGNFVDYSKGMLIDGLFATLNIVLFGIFLGFFLGVTLSMMKTSPTTLKEVAQKRSLILVRLFGAVSFIVGFMFLDHLIPIIEGLGLNGWEYIYAPIGIINPGGITGDLQFENFAYLILGVSLLLLGGLFISANGKYKKSELEIFGRTVIWNPWGVRPLNFIATIYTDIFRNTPLIVQFLFIHFGVQIGALIGDPLAEMLEGSTGLITSFLRDDVLSNRACVSAIFALGLNSGAYQCETIRGAIAAIPSGQMEAGRSIGLNYMQTMRLVIMPQAIRICIPPMGNEMVNLVLNSSLAMVIGYSELTRKAKLINAVTFQVFWSYGMVLISYFIVTWTLALILRYLENKTRIPGLGISGGN
ncbi:MAG: hypothetical protein CMB45_05925 [Euryarchaeota archaeon]|nr:hypothetical protein [Euryarchaeota archaeon]